MPNKRSARPADVLGGLRAALLAELEPPAGALPDLRRFRRSFKMS